MKTQDLFDDPKPRKKREWLMHVSDCGTSNYCGHIENGEQIVKMKCWRCESETDWISMPSVTEAKRGIPCEKCNGGSKAK